MKLRSDTITAILTIALAFKASMNATAVEVAATVDPILSGTGPNLTARFPNVASVDGQNVDLYGQILSQTTNKTNTFWQGPPWGLPGDFVFQFLEGVPGEVRSATVRWTFYLSGTNTPISVSGLSLTIDDLDNGGSRHESFDTEDATSFTLNDPTNITANLVNGNVSIVSSGGVEQNPGDPEAAARLDFRDGSSFTITYHVTFGSADRSAFHHDGEGDFTFDDPVNTPVPPTPPRIYYTYRFENDTESPVAMSFNDRAPPSFKWDSSYAPFVPDPSFEVEISYSDSDHEADADLVVPPGGAAMTLRTMESSATGFIDNEATVTPSAESGFEPLTASASVDIEAPSGTTIVVDADFDTSISQGAANWNGDNVQLYSTYDDGTQSQTLVYFDLTNDITGPATIDSAVVYLTSTDPHGDDEPFALHKILPGVDWISGGLTWNSASGGLATDGTELGSNPEDQSELVNVIPGVSGSADRKKWDITSLVQAWIDAPTSNNGFAILPTEPFREIFCSKEHLGESVRPKLVITYH